MEEEGKVCGESMPETGIPAGLNRIKTRRVSLKDPRRSRCDHDAEKIFDSRTGGLPSYCGNLKQRGHGNRDGSTEGRHKGKKIARWFRSHIFKDSNNQYINDATPNSGYSEPDVKGFVKECLRTRLHKVGKQAIAHQTSPESMCTIKVPKGLKSFSHELGPTGGIYPLHPRSHSYDNLKELLGSLRSRFDAVKEVVNLELGCFAGEVMELLDKPNFLCPEAQKLLEDLLILCQDCVKMTSLQFRTKCETIVQDLTDKRKQCQTGLLKWLFTRMLFILTRCTRLLHFERGSEPIDEKSLHKFKKCLDSVPVVEMNWDPDRVIADSGPFFSLSQLRDIKHGLQEESKVPRSLEKTACQFDMVAANEPKIASRKDFMAIDLNSLPQSLQSDLLSRTKEYHQLDGSCLIDTASCSVDEQERNSDGCDSVICRICEEIVATSHLESHSYICAYAEKCDLKCSDMDDRLLKLAEMLEQIIQSFNISVHGSYDSPEGSRIRIPDPAIVSEGCSPKISEWRSKGVEGMFEDLHEMDTACIDDSHVATTNLKGLSGMKLVHCGPPSSAGSITSGSSTNTPKTNHFDFFWLEHSNSSELESVQQMTDLVDIARCVAGTDLSEEGSSEFLLACLEDLQDVLQHSKMKALVVDTFGNRIESLLREKYILACDLLDAKGTENNSGQIGSYNVLLDMASQSSTMSTPRYHSHKERTSIEDFEIIKPISKGAFGKVFLARKRTTGDLFAIKVLKKLDMIRKNDIEHILAERNILITVRNPFVVRFFYSFTSRDNLYLVMEYLNGGDLYSLLRKVGCLEEHVARIYIAELLTDFGLSKIGLMNSTGDLPGPDTDGVVLLDAHGQHTLERDERNEHAAVGTPDYLAPEILLGTEHGYAADWWSVGIILFEFITGIPPFTAERPEMIFDNILNRKVPWPSVPDDMSYEAQDLIDRFLAHDPDQRLGAKGSSEVKAHPFFKGVNWDTLALQKAAFVPRPDSVDDTSYFMSRYSQFSNGLQHDPAPTETASDISDSNSGAEKMDECGDLEQFESSFDLSLINFSFKNLSQLATINHDVLLQNWRSPSKCSSCSKDPNL
ncbi:probable serine/threonine protein kinase IRE4 isoform X2 [Diospyros lotus]|uniref:probable serine/threonine protein kinase IRE4 isoform X2 n=1 Tax=Diospyros lotus TaxID=55363 RepID=UPI00225A2E1D|nr:probable serine/threonine protein kinase IRE4 isoform X2 [Diospyros lotus]